MKRLGAIVAAGIVASGSSCVPASEPAPPAGAIGFSTEPSPGAQGMPLLTADGWTVRFERLAIQVDVSATPRDMTGQRFYGSSETYRFDASKRVEIFARALPVGMATASLSLSGRYIGDLGGRKDYEEERTTILELPPEVIARFKRPADLSAGSPSYPEGPSIVLSLRAEKGDRVITVDVAMDAATSPLGGGTSREVTANALASIPLRVFPEAFFRDSFADALLFGDFAAADTDDDGRLSPDELYQGSSSRFCGGAEPCRSNLAETLRGRAAGLFIIP